MTQSEGGEEQQITEAMIDAELDRQRRRKIQGIVGGAVVAVLGIGAIVGAFLWLGSTGGPSDAERAQAVCKTAAADQMKDPESAQFEHVGSAQNTAGAWTVSGAINAKNSFGGYVGYSLFTCTATGSGDSMKAVNATIAGN